MHGVIPRVMQDHTAYVSRSCKPDLNINCDMNTIKPSQFRVIATEG